VLNTGIKVMEKLEPGVARQTPESDVAIETLSENGAAGNKEYLTALSWAARGVPVFPCKNTPGDPTTHKAPHTSHGFHDATTNPDLIRSWWAQWPNALIGMPTGPRSGFDVIDIDRKKGKDGTKAIPDWAELSSVISLTVNNGIHLWFRANGQVRG